ncbi:TonB-dependent receptor domain-containing protein [Dokdonella ginsengisoli]|uniref:TonB-dependent receptor domain-containing protein n=1 Tax=Dokdonella ginsengisoli TaxID=363846 RepID=A0ABV9QYH7_9GAMM
MPKKLLFTAIALSLPTAAFSQEEEVETPFSSVSESERKNAEGKISSLEQITVTARRIKGDALSYPGAVSVISPEVIEREQASTVIDLLNLVPGFNLDYDVGRDIGRNFTLRGFGFADEDRVIVKVDGARRSFNFANQISTFGVDPEMLREVEVVRGSSSVVHGGGAFGGVMEMRTKDARDLLRDGEAFGTRIKLGYNDNNRSHVAAHVFGTNDARNFDYLLSALGTNARTHQLAGGLDVPTKNDKREGLLKLRYAPASDHELHFKLQSSKMDVRNPWNTLWHLAEWTDTEITGTHTQQDVAASWYYTPAGSWINLAVDVFANRTEYDRRIWDLPPIDEYSGLVDRNRYAGVNAQNLTRFSTGAVRHTVQFGFDATARKEDQFDKYTREYALLASAKSRDYGLYLQDSMSFGERGQWEVLAAARYDRFEREAGRLSQPLPQESTDTYDSHRLSPRLGLGWQANDWLRVFANYSEVFRAPSAFELYATGSGNPWTFWVPNLGLKAEVGREYEGGIALDLGSLAGVDALLFKLNAFRGDFEDFIDLVDIDPRTPIAGDTGVGGTLRDRLNQYRNLDSVERRGIEVEGSFRNGNWSADLVYSKLKVRDEETGSDVPHAFADKLLLTAGYRIAPIDVQLDWRLNWYFAAPNRPARNASGQWLIDRSFKTHDVFVSWRPRAWSGFALAGGVRNVFDQEVIRPGYPGTTTQVGIGRSVFGEASWQF